MDQNHQIAARSNIEVHTEFEFETSHLPEFGRRPSKFVGNEYQSSVRKLTDPQNIGVKSSLS